jgi:acyl-CoA thioesterase-1
MRVWLAAALCVMAAGCGREAEPTVSERTEPARREPAAPTTPDDRPVIVAFGNSLTAGPGVGDGVNYPAVLQGLLNGRGYRYRVENAGVSGDTTGGGLARIDTVLAYQPAIVILELGANDGLRGLPIESTRGNLEAMIRRFQAAHAQVILAGMTLPPNYGPAYVRSFERIFVELSEKYKTIRIPFFLDGVAARPALLLADQMHPNEAGYKIVAANVMRALEPALARR